MSGMETSGISLVFSPCKVMLTVQRTDSFLPESGRQRTESMRTWA